MPFSLLSRTLASQVATGLWPRLKRCSASLLVLAALSFSASAWSYTMPKPVYGSDRLEKQLDPRFATPKEPSPEELMRIQLTPNPEVEQAEIKEIFEAGESPLLIYGNYDRLQFLGCLNCHPQYRISIWNSDGPYGSNLGYFSLWNGSYEYGNDISPLSPWNEFGGVPPAVVDPAGNFYGFLTRNKNQMPRFTNNFIETVFFNYTAIRDNSRSYYQKAFAEHMDLKTIPLSFMESFPQPIDPAVERENTVLPPDNSDFNARDLWQ